MGNKMVTRNQYNPTKVSHPGVTLDAKIREMEMSVREFAIRAAKSENTILGIIRGENPITPEMAMIFENITQIPAHFWIARQRIYDEYVISQRGLSSYPLDSLRSKRYEGVGAIRSSGRSIAPLIS